MEFNAVEEPIVHYGGCLCTRLYFRITFPADSEYPIAGHCHCDSCRKASGSFTSTSIAIPPNCLEFAVRVTHPDLPLNYNVALDQPVAEPLPEILAACSSSISTTELMSIEAEGSQKAEVPYAQIERREVPVLSQVASAVQVIGGPSKDWEPTPPPPIPTIGPSESSAHSRIWRHLSSIAAIEQRAQSQRQCIRSNTERSADEGSSSDETIKEVAAATPSSNPPAYETAEWACGFEIFPGLKVPWPYREYQSSPGVFRGFCSQCSGTLIFRTACRDTLYIKAGSLDDPTKAISGRFDAEWWTSNKFPEDWGLNLGTPSELGDVHKFAEKE